MTTEPVPRLTDGFLELQEQYANSPAMSKTYDDASDVDTDLCGKIVIKGSRTGFDRRSYCIVAFFAHGPSSASSPDAFFEFGIDHLRGQPGVMLFLSCDESVLGRCTTVSRSGAAIAITLVDSRIDPSSLCEYCFEHEMASFAHWARELRMAVNRDKANYELRRAVDRAKDAGAERMVTIFAKGLFTYNPARSTRTVPDIACLLGRTEHGPVVRVDHAYEAIASIATIRGGRVAIICTDDGDIRTELVAFDGAITPEVQMAELVFVVSQNSKREWDPSYVHLMRAGDQDTHRYLIWCDGVSAAHLVHVIDEAVAIGYRAIDNADNFGDALISNERLLTHPCDREVNLRVLANRVKASRLRHAMGRFVDANLETIKARLWAPERPLFQRQMSAQLR
jgi:hypothetical protein